MNPSLEDIFDQALTELRQGKAIDEIISTWPEQATELRSLLEIAALAQSVPHNVVPTPLRRRKFAESIHRSWWLNMAGLLKFGVMPLTLVMMVLGARTLIIKAEQSLPTDNLYSLKRASEQLQLAFTRDSTKQAVFQVELTQRRLDEVKRAAASEDPVQEAAALAELKNQTQKTFTTLPQVAAAAAIASKDSSLLNSLVAMNKQQQEVLASIEPQAQAETKDIAATALSNAKETEKTLLALVATVNEQTLIDLDDKVSLSGDATANSDRTKITIDDTTFIITKDTVVTGTAGQSLQRSDLPAKSKVNIVGIKDEDNDTITAKFITLLPAEEESPTEEPAPAQPESAPAGSEPQTPTNSSSSEPESDQNEVTAGVIVEPAAP